MLMSMNTEDGTLFWSTIRKSRVRLPRPLITADAISLNILLAGNLYKSLIPRCLQSHFPRPDTGLLPDSDTNVFPSIISVGTTVSSMHSFMSTTGFGQLVQAPPAWADFRFLAAWYAVSTVDAEDCGSEATSHCDTEGDPDIVSRTRWTETKADTYILRQMATV